MSAILRGWAGEISAELADALEALTAANAAADEAHEKAASLSQQHREVTVALADLPRTPNLSRAIAGRVERLKADRDAADQQALYARRPAVAATERVGILETALAQLEQITGAPETTADVVTLQPASAA